jgi:hypothetical protein
MNQRTATTPLGLGKDPDPPDTKYQRKPSKPVPKCEELDILLLQEKTNKEEESK